jgi:hypothetical protein
MRPIIIGLMSVTLSAGCSDEPDSAPLGKAKLGSKASSTVTQDLPDEDRPDALRAENPSTESDTPETADTPPDLGDEECPDNLKKIQALANTGIKADIWEPTASRDWSPDGSPGATARDWSTDDAFASLNWQPEGQVRGSYRVTTTAESYSVHCISDIDGDGVQSTWTVGASGEPGRKE